MAEPGVLRAELLGRVRAWLGPDEIKLGPARQRAVFAVLVLRAGRQVTLADLTSAVWGGDPPESVNGNIHTYISGLRRVLEPDRSRRAAGTRLTGERGTYTLHVEQERVDVSVFEQLVSAAQAASSPADVVSAADEALALWHGDPLSGIPGPYAERERDRLAALRLDALEARARAGLAMARHRMLVSELTSLVREHPFRESLRALVMEALYRSGRPAEALEEFQHLRRTLVEELGVEPGPAVRELQERILAEDLGPVPSGQGNMPLLLGVLPAQVVQNEQESLVGRDAELVLVRELIEDLRGGRGGALWVEGDFGMGKSALLTAALADVTGHGCQLGWVVADELRARVPLQVVLDCLGVDSSSADPRRSALAKDLFRTDSRPGVWGEVDLGLVIVDRIVSLVDELCAQAPVVLVVDDMQWADEMSVQFWHRLYAATRQLPLLLVAAARPAPRSQQLTKLRHTMETSGGRIVDLGPLSDVDAVVLQETILGAAAGPRLRELVAGTGGSPLYIKELTEVMRREDVLDFAGGSVDLSTSKEFSVPQSMAAALYCRLRFLPDEVHQSLQVAALLGAEFTVADLAAIIGRPPLDLVRVLEEAVRANVLIDAESKLAFRHPVLWYTFYNENPVSARPSLHRQAAEALSTVNAPLPRIAEQLATANVVDSWVLGWLLEHHEPLASRAPQLAVDLLSCALDACPPRDPACEVLAAALTKVLFRLDHAPMAEARRALAIATDPDRKAEMRHLIAVMLYRQGEVETAVHMIEEVAGDETVPEIWRRRHRHLLANFRRGGLDDLDDAERVALLALETADDEYLIAHALQTRWLIASVRRDHRAALAHIDAAIDAVKPVSELADLQVDLLDNRLFTLENLDRLDDVDTTLRGARRVAAENDLPAALQVSTAVHYYWVGRWNEAFVELDSVTEDGPAITFYGLREPPAAALLMHGVAALIAGRRGDRIQAGAHLDAAAEFGPATRAQRESFDFLLMAQAVAAEQGGDPDGALAVLDPVLTPTYAQMMLRHQWLPSLVRIALSVGDLERATEALQICEEEAEKEVVSARANAAALWCRGLLADDPAPLLTVADRYRSAGRSVELAMVQEDAAVLLARNGRIGAAEAAFDEATNVFAELSARWDLERAEGRLAEFGIKRGIGAAPLRPDRGWDSLSPTEVEIATLVAAGRSNPEIADRLGLSRRTVQAHVLRLVGKLDLASRAGVARRVTSHA